MPPPSILWKGLGKKFDIWGGLFKIAILRVSHIVIGPYERYRRNYRYLSNINQLVSTFCTVLKNITIQNFWHQYILLIIIVDSSLTFDNHVKTICKKASQKLTGISIMSNFMSKIKRKALIKTFFESQFNYCPLIWMFCSRTLNLRINRLH